LKRIKNIISIIRGLRAPFDKKNAKAIFLCLITAFIFWLFNSLNKEYTARIDFPITFVYNTDSLISLDKLPSRISVNVTGGGWTLLRRSVGLSDKPLEIDLEDPTSQKYLTQYSLLNIATDQLEELTVNFIINDTIYFNIERKVQKAVMIELDTSALNIAEDYEIVSGITIQPDSVQLTGPESVIEGLKGIIKLPVPDSNIDQDYSEEIPVSLGVPDIVKSEPENVNVYFQVEEFQTRDIQQKIERINFPNKSLFLLSDANVDLNVYYPVSKSEEMDTSKLKVIADYNKLNKGDSTIRLEFQNIPSFVRSFNPSRSTVKVIYQ